MTLNAMSFVESLKPPSPSNGSFFEHHEVLIGFVNECVSTQNTRETNDVFIKIQCRFSSHSCVSK